MPYGRLLNEGRIRLHTFSQSDIEDYVATAEAKLRDAGVAGLSAEGQYIFAYDAVRWAAQAVMAAEGYRTTHQTGHHATVFEFLRQVDAGRWRTEADQFDDTRKKRNRSQYERFGLITETEAKQLIPAASTFLREVKVWLQQRGLHR